MAFRKDRLIKPSWAIFLFLPFFLIAGLSFGDSKKGLDLKPEKARLDLAPLSFSTPTQLSPPLTLYAETYSFQFAQTDHFLGFITQDGLKIAVNAFRKEASAGTVYLAHGLFGHAGFLRHLIRFLNDEGYNVIVFDLPGHGLSSGERYSTTSFSLYAKILKKVFQETSASFPGPYHFIGFSTGASAGYEFISRDKDPFEKVVFLAPLIRSRKWALSKTGFFILRPFIKRVPRVYKTVSSDPTFKTFFKNDPFGAGSLPLSYVKALFVWNKKLKTYPVLERPILIIQGEEDSVVWSDFNLEFFKEKLPRLKTVLIPQAKHELTNETEPMRAEVFSSIKNWLKD